ncbi:NAD-dependent epimerase/dehydratase family protein [Sediminibacterium soli]|uniref:NAD-dependent epimerase/dehydratase family protein n=1 Tax=Sediminibacterium soli TaxID=2698829 RepID=UPI001379804C|nr:NAD-dependent epimerase/dehydratase family protein [Sediminibacterium soli]NCI46361.1 NAD-dependent epimerase/dehydratase family protein [Sediminibacterium soli]
MAIKVIVTGATGMVGEGVVFECLQNPEVSEVLVIGRRHFDYTHPKLKELLVPDFFSLSQYHDRWKGYDACFFCAGISSVGLNEEKYTRITYDTTIAFAKALLEENGKQMAFCYVSGSHTDSTETSKMMWARVKGKTENALLQLPFRDVYNFRPGFMKPVKGQKNVKKFFYPIIFLVPKLFPSKSLTLEQVAQAMINSVTKGFPKKTLEIPDIRALAGK